MLMQVFHMVLLSNVLMIHAQKASRTLQSRLPQRVLSSMEAIDPNSTARDCTALLLSVLINGVILFFSSHSFNVFSKQSSDTASIEITRVVLSKPEQPISQQVVLSAPPDESPIKQIEKAPVQVRSPRPNFVDRNQINKKSTVQNIKTEQSKDLAPSPNVQENSENFLVPSIEAQPLEQIKPEIPFEVRSQEYKSYVRVKVEIDIDGTSNPSLKTSSGNQKVDAAVLSALKKWSWHPALLDGRSIKSVRYFKFEFEVK